jgi:hypothetical protein
VDRGRDFTKCVSMEYEIICVRWRMLEVGAWVHGIDASFEDGNLGMCLREWMIGMGPECVGMKHTYFYSGKFKSMENGAVSVNI